MRSSRQSTIGSQDNLGPTDVGPDVLDSGRIPFAQRVTCTIADACEATGLGRTKTARRDERWSPPLGGCSIATHADEDESVADWSSLAEGKMPVAALPSGRS